MAIREGGWVIFLAHEVGEGAHQHLHPETLRRLCRYCTSDECELWCGTVEEVGRYIRSAARRQDEITG
jgi:hypothetical protein